LNEIEKRMSGGYRRAQRALRHEDWQPFGKVGVVEWLPRPVALILGTPTSSREHAVDRRGDLVVERNATPTETPRTHP
jgi:hypothetical protein